MSFGDSVGYGFGFQGQMRDDDISGQGKLYTAEYWKYDSRLGRRWNVDPVIKYHESPYAAFGNNPVWFIDPNGADSTTYFYSEVDEDELNRIAEVSKEIDRRNGLTETQYQVFATEDDFKTAIDNGEVNLNKKNDLVFSVKYGKIGDAEFDNVVGRAWRQLIFFHNGKALYGGALSISAYEKLYKKEVGGEDYTNDNLVINLGIYLNHERIAHGYGAFWYNYTFNKSKLGIGSTFFLEHDEPGGHYITKEKGKELFFEGNKFKYNPFNHAIPNYRINYIQFLHGKIDTSYEPWNVLKSK